MLDQAHQRLENHHWSNIELVQSDAASYQFSEGVDGILSTFAITLVPEYERIIKNGAAALASGKRFVILDNQAARSLARLADTGFCLCFQALRRLVGFCRSASLGIDRPIFKPGAVSGILFWCSLLYAGEALEAR
jgi:ubiquinone/menaquinone biosynthesis C-methylase UbiE